MTRFVFDLDDENGSNENYTRMTRIIYTTIDENYTIDDELMAEETLQFVGVIRARA
jgi:hypothetical protein